MSPSSVCAATEQPPPHTGTKVQGTLDPPVDKQDIGSSDCDQAAKALAGARTDEIETGVNGERMLNIGQK